MAKNNFPLIVLGRRIGMVTGWDQSDTMVFQYYGFVPEEGVSLPEADIICIHYDRGSLEVFLKMESESPEQTFDLIDAIKGLPILPPSECK